MHIFWLNNENFFDYISNIFDHITSAFLTMISRINSDFFGCNSKDIIMTKPKKHQKSKQ